MPEQTSQIDEIFWAALQIESPDDRSAYLDEACGNDRDLRALVAQLLAAQPKAERFLESAFGLDSPTIDQPLTEQPGDTIGPYKLHEQIGEGGFGIVYLAEQSEPVKRRVALKIIKPGMDTKEVISRFEAERQALALMDHPGIARVLDAGATESGRPYFVMELVKGISITDYCDQSHLATRDRLQLFLQVCQAIQHAHQKGVIHRDVKPSNVLIAMQDGIPVPKVIDFGVAKAINQRLTEHTLMTRFAQVVGTPLYMSPEQAEMSPLEVDTRSDIYSLGVLLYELLTGTTPFERERLKEATFDEMRRIIREEEPLRPSARISTLGAEVTTVAEKRRTEPRKLQQIVRGDLDWIALKALEKDRTRRYETASGLADDIERYLSDEPVQACPPSAGYRFRKFARRNKLALITTAAIMVAVITLAIGASMAAVKFENLAVRATHEQERAEGNLDLALQALDAVYLDAIGTEKLLADRVSRPGAEGSDFTETAPPLSDFEKELLRRGLTFYDEFATRNANTPHAAAHTARAYYRVAMLHGALEDHSTAAAAFTEAINRFEALLRNQPENDTFWHELGRAHFGLGRIQSEWSDAEREYSKAEEAVTAAIQLNGDAPEFYQSRSEIRIDLGDYLHAQEDAAKAVTLAPENLDFLLDAVTRYYACAHQYRDFEKATEYCEGALELAPNDPRVHTVFAHVLFYTDGPRCVEHLTTALEIDPNNPLAYNLRARIYHFGRDLERALADAEQAVLLDPENGEHRLRRAGVHTSLQNFDLARADLAAADELLPPGAPTRVRLHEEAGHLFIQTQDYRGAVTEFTRAIRLRPQMNWNYAYRSIPRFFLGEYDKALEDIRTSFELQPGDWNPLFRIPSRRVATCPDSGFRDGLLDLASEMMESCPHGNLWSTYAELLSACGCYDDAERAYQRSIEMGLRDGLELHLYRFALMQLSRGNHESAHQSCMHLMNEFGETDDPAIAGVVAWSCTLSPDLVENHDRSIELALLAAEADPGSVEHLKTLGVALYRAGRYEEAAARLEESDQRMGEPDMNAEASPAYTWYLLAMTHHALGQAEAAHTWLAKANEWAHQVLTNEDEPPVWNRRMTLELLRDEANSLIDVPKPDDASGKNNQEEQPPAPPTTQRDADTDRPEQDRD